MTHYMIRRILFMAPTLLAISVISFVIIVLPPGDFLSSYIADLQAQGAMSEQATKQAEALRERYGLDRPLFVQYTMWLGKLVRGDFGYAFT